MALRLNYFAVDEDGNLTVDMGNLLGRGITQVQVRGDVVADLPVESGYPATATVPPLVDGQTYNVVIRLVAESGDFSTPVAVTAEAFEGSTEVGYVGFPGFSFGSAVPNSIQAPDIAPVGPVTSIGLFALFGFDPSPSGFPSLPGMVYDPTFQPAEELRWLYIKSADGHETLQLVSPPDTFLNGASVRLWLSPQGIPHFVRTHAKTGANPNKWDIQGWLLAIEPSSYGTVPSPPTIVAQYQVTGVGRHTNVSLHWAEGQPVLTSSFRDPGEPELDIVVVTTPSSTTYNPLGGDRFSGNGTLATTDTGRYFAEVVEPI